MITITLKPPATANGRWQAGFEAVLGDRALCRSEWPFADAAAVLLTEGVPGDTVLEARHEGSPITAMRSTVLAAALLKDGPA
jgi:hypothetical protein